jgi:polysaccharide export outer membrane protein
MTDFAAPPMRVATAAAPILPVDPLRKGFVEKGAYPEYIVGPDDVLDLVLRDVVPVRETVTVRPDGNISFLLVENLPVAGLTIGELDSALTVAVSRYLRAPKINVEVSEYGSKVVSLLGAIESLGTAAASRVRGAML